MGWDDRRGSGLRSRGADQETRQGGEEEARVREARWARGGGVPWKTLQVRRAWG